ncbi:hypothetical protein ACOMHN_051402 [Nucella lapillus]
MLTTVAVTVAFIICWAPFHTQRLMVLYVHSWTPDMLAAQSHIFYVSGVLYFVSSTVNPILYNVISRRYRVAFKQTICGPCRQYARTGSLFSRQSFGSNAPNSRRKGGDLASQQHQRHSLLGPESPRHTSLRQPVFSRRSLFSETRGSGTSEVRRHSSKARFLAPVLCPAGLHRKKKKREGGYSAAAETKYSLDDLGESQSHYIQLKALSESKHPLTNTESNSANHCNNVLYAAHQLDDKHQPEKGFYLGEKPNDYQLGNSSTRIRKTSSDQLCNSSTRIRKTSSEDERIKKTATSLTEMDTHPLNPTKRKNDSNDNSYNPRPNVEENGERTYGTISGPVGEKTSPFASAPCPSSSTHQHSLARESDSSVSLCKQCLTNPSLATTNGAAPFSDVEAYHVGFDVNKPHSHL